MTALTMKVLVAEAMARRAAFGELRAWGGRNTPPWVSSSRCAVGSSATDAALRALLRLPDPPRPKRKRRQRPRLAAVDDPRKRYGRLLRRTSPPPEHTDFAYVVRAQEQARVAFGSAQSRAVLPLAGPGGGASRLALLAVKATDDLDHLGPAKYTTPTLGALHDVLTRVTTKRPDVGPGGSTAPRFREVDQHLPAPNTYQLPSRRPATPSKAPFNTTTTRRPLVTSNTPGPGSYNPGAFSQPGVAVVVRCGQGDGPGRCEACQEELAAEFWSLDGHVVQGLPRDALMCQACMQSARALLRAAGARSKTRFTRWQLDAFKKTRDCSDIHRHEGTKSKISLVDPKTVAKRRRKEAYLAKYFRDQAVVNPNLMAGTEPAKLTEAEVDAGRGPRPDAFCCLHEAFNSFNKDNMSFGLRSLRVPSDVLYNTMRRCALDFHPSRSSSTRTSVRESVRGSVRESTTRRPSRTN